MNSKLIITFPDTFRIGSIIDISIIAISDSNLSVFNKSTVEFKNKLYLNYRSKGEILLDPNNAYEVHSGIAAATYFVYYFNYDYNQSGVYTIIRENNKVTLELNDENFIFKSTDANIESLEVLNIEEAKELSITSSEISSSLSNACSKFSLKLNTSSDFNKVSINGVVENFSNTSTKTLDLLRNTQYKISLTNDDGKYALFPTSGFLIIPSLEESNFTIEKIVSFGSNNVRITSNNFSLLKYEYSINDIDWVSTGLFENLQPGQYTIYVRDYFNSTLLGCKISIDITIDENEINNIVKTPFIEISKANSINFIKRENTDNLKIFQNNSNSFSYEQKNAYIYCDEILFQNDDSTKIQLKTSYDNITATLIDENGNEDNILITQLTDNINRFKALDGILISYTEEKSLVYFNKGNLYDINGDITEQYSLNGGLPDFAIIGEKIEVVGFGVFTIEDVLYIDSIESNCIVISLDYTGNVESEVIIRSEYNLLEYNVFDFIIDWSVYGNGLYEVRLSFDDDLFESALYISENINIKDYHENTLAIKYFNTNNRDIFYKYNIEHFIRIPYLLNELLIKDDIEYNISDNSVQVLKSTLNEGCVITFDDMTRNMAIKVAIALSSEYLFINGEGYVKSDSIELEPITNTNNVALKVNLLKNNTAYSNISDYVTGESIKVGDIDIPDVVLDNIDLILTKSSKDSIVMLDNNNYLKK